MSEMKFKPEQQAVLDSIDKNLIVSASAGSGKTTVMLQKILEDITLRKKSIKSILVLTYTKASAEEMKQRLVEKLYANAKDNPQLLSQIDDLAVADISTIHSFFQKMLKKYFTAVNLSADFAILDDTQSINLVEIALENTLEKFAEKNSNDFQSLLEVFGKTRNDKVIKNVITKIYNFLKSSSDPKNFKNKIATKLYEKDLNKNLAIKIINEKLSSDAIYFAKKLSNLQKMLYAKELKDYVEICNKFLSVFDNIKAEQDKFLQNLDLICDLPSVRINKNLDFMEEYRELFMLIDSIKKYSAKIKKWGFSKENINNFLNITPSLINSLIILTENFEKEYAVIKQQKNLLDYDDLEKYMLLLLKNKDIKNEIISNYEIIYVDEYQDANRVQEKILSSICKANNRFMVGDVKQSIYRFRQAEPDIFLENQKLFEKDENGDVKFLNCNFRSNKTILDFVNIVFNKIMTEKSAKIDYKNTSNLKGEAIYESILGQNIPAVEINIIEKEDVEEKPIPEKIYTIKEHKNADKNYTDAQLEGFFVANKIAELIGKKIYIPSLKTEKIIEYKDITILLRSRGKFLGEFCEVLSNFNIPIFANTSEPLYKDSDIQLLISLLSLCVNYNNDIALASVMHSVFGNFSYNELAKIRLNSVGDSFFDCINNYAKEDNLCKKLKNFKSFIENLSFNIRYEGVYSALNNVIENSDFLPYVLNKSDGLEKTEKVKKFLNDFLKNNYNYDILGFLNFAKQNEENIVSPNFASGENCINITTIHASKGLEYPIVILANAGKSLNKEPDDKSVQINQNFGIGIKYFDIENRKKYNSIALEAINLENFKDNFAEKLRLLYVALTRAKNHLIIVGTSKNDFFEIQNDYEILKQNSYLSLILNSLPQKILDEVKQGKDIKTNLYNINVINGKTEINFAENSPNIIQKIEDKIQEKKINNYLNYKYPYQTDITTKNSVSSILQQETPYVSHNLSPKEFKIRESTTIKANDLGTVYHSIMQEIDFKTANYESILNIVDKKYNEYKNQINIEKIIKCANVINKFNAKNMLKEQKFVMNLPYNYLIKSQNKDEILVQGIIDLILFGKENILIDYKLTNIKDKNIIINKYYVQLKLYKTATEFALNKKIGKVFILLINTGELVEINV